MENLSHFDLSTEDEIIGEQILQEEMSSVIILEDKEQRQQVVTSLKQIAQEWLRDFFMQKRKHTEEEAKSYGGTVLSFGSYRLGVMDADSDVDCVLVANRFVDRSVFFDSFVQRLKNHPDITDVTPVPEAFVPVVKFRMNTINVDLSFARLAPDCIQPDGFHALDDSVLRNVDEQTARSMNGVRVAEKIIKLVPRSDFEQFRSALLYIKLWAKARGLYGNVYGYPGGIAWALLTAYLCNVFPAGQQITAIRFIFTFFSYWSSWPWPKPVFLTPMEDLKMGFKNWISTPGEITPVITPCYPGMNCLYNVTPSSQRALQEEWLRARDLCNQACVEMQHSDAGAKGDCFRRLLQTLWQKSDFFMDYKMYIQVSISATSREDYLAWQGYVESRLRLLTGRYMNSIPNSFRAHLHPECFSDKELECQWYIGITADGTPRLDLSLPIIEWRRSLFQWGSFTIAPTMNGPDCKWLSRWSLPSRLFTMEQKAILRAKAKRHLSLTTTTTNGQSMVDAPTERKQQQKKQKT